MRILEHERSENAFVSTQSFRELDKDVVRDKRIREMMANARNGARAYVRYLLTADNLSRFASSEQAIGHSLARYGVKQDLVPYAVRYTLKVLREKGVRIQ